MLFWDSLLHIQGNKLGKIFYAIYECLKQTTSVKKIWATVSQESVRGAD